MDSEIIINVEKPATWTRRLTITVPAQRLARERESTARRLAQKVRLPGFRKGKVPAGVIEKRFGAAVDQEMIERVVNETYREALQKENLQPITQASINEIDYKPGSDLTYHADFEVRPEIELERLGGFEVRRQVPEVTADAVDRVLQRLREQHAVWQPVEAEPPVHGDMAVVEITPRDGEGAGNARRYQVYMGEGQVRPEIEEVIRTLKVGESGDFSVDLPEDAENPDSALRAHRIGVQVIEARRPQYPSLDDDFARSVGEFDSYEALRARVTDDLLREAEHQAHEEGRRQLIDQVLQANPFEVPDTMVDRYLEQAIKPRKNDDAAKIAELRENARPAATHALRRMLVIERIADLEALHPTPDELDQGMAELAQRHGRPLHEIRAQLKKEGREHELEEQITEEKVFRYLESLSTIE